MSCQGLVKTWTTRFGERLLICKMAASHLINVRRMLRRAAVRDLTAAQSCFPSCNGEMAQYYAEQAFDQMASMTPDEYARENWPVFRAIEREIQRRKLDTPLR